MIIALKLTQNVKHSIMEFRVWCFKICFIFTSPAQIKPKIFSAIMNERLSVIFDAQFAFKAVLDYLFDKE